MCSWIQCQAISIDKWILKVCCCSFSISNGTKADCCLSCPYIIFRFFPEHDFLGSKYLCVCLRLVSMFELYGISLLGHAHSEWIKCFLWHPLNFNIFNFFYDFPFYCPMKRSVDWNQGMWDVYCAFMLLLIECVLCQVVLFNPKNIHKDTNIHTSNITHSTGSQVYIWHSKHTHTNQLFSVWVCVLWLFKLTGNTTLDNHNHKYDTNIITFTTQTYTCTHRPLTQQHTNYYYLCVKLFALSECNIYVCALTIQHITNITHSHT